ncbi:MAG: hypothetical protein U5R48_10625 [Gammaproteobacteria bacterium]|nr:hypothetical protein [Gammaproteobacteria bacterium]
MLAAADPTTTARVMLDSGLLADAARAPRLYRDALIRLEVPDNGDKGLATSILSTFPPAQLRERWIEALAERLDPATLAAARDFHGSIPGLTLGAALTRSHERLNEDERRRLAKDGPEPATAITRTLVEATGAGIRERILRVRTAGMALWTARVVRGEASGRGPGPGLRRCPGGDPGHAPGGRAPRLLGRTAGCISRRCCNSPTSPAGRRFHAAVNDALDAALEQLAHAQAGVFMERVGAQASAGRGARRSLRIDAGPVERLQDCRRIPNAR